MKSKIVIPSFDPEFIETQILNPERHFQSVAGFLKYFQISPRGPDLDFLSEILLGFSQLPYENLSKIIRHKERTEWLDKIRMPEAVMDEHARFKFGGTCFSLTFTLETILTRLGFVCYPVMADMRWKPNSHSVLLVEWQGDKYLVDPGYLLNQPMQLNVEKPRIYHSDVSGVEVAYDAGEQVYHLYTFSKDQTKWRYRFRDIPCSRIDFLGYWLDSYTWNSMHGLLLTRVEKGKMVYVHKTFMRETTFDSKRNLNIKQNYHAAIRAVFGIDETRVEEALSALDENMAWERNVGLWVPGDKRKTKE